MKRFSFFIFSTLTALSLAAALLFSGCGAASSAPQPASPGGAKEAEAPALHALQDTAMFHTAVGNEAGAYCTAQNTDGFSLLTYIDYAQKKWVPLCSRPECAHADETCTAWFAKGQGITRLLLDETQLYAYCGGFDQPATLLAIDLNGGSRRLLHTFGLNEDLRSGMAADADALYYLKSVVDQATGAEHFELARLPLDGGQEELVCRFDDCASGILYGAAEGRLLVRKTMSPDPSRDMLLQADNLHGQVVAIDPATGQAELLTEWPTAGAFAVSDSDALYLIDLKSPARTVTRFDYRTKETAALAQKIDTLTDSLDLTGMSRIYDGHLFFDVMTVTDEERMLRSIDRYAVDCKTGEAVHVSLAYQDPYLPDDRDPVTLVAETADSFLVATGCEYRPFTTTGQLGEPMEALNMVTHYALIKKSDYYQSIPNYQPIEDCVSPS